MHLKFLNIKKNNNEKFRNEKNNFKTNLRKMNYCNY